MTKHSEPPTSPLKKVLAPKPAKKPRFPFFKDETLWRGHFTVRMSMRAILMSVLAAILILLLAALYFVNQYEKVNHLAHDNQNAQTTGHTQRLQDQARTDAKIAQLACSIVALVPPGVNPKVDQIRVRYDCVPGAAPTPTAAGQPSSKPTVKPSSTVPKPTSTPQGVAPQPTVTATRTATATATATATRVVTTPSPTSTALIDLPGTLCSLGRIINLCSSP